MNEQTNQAITILEGRANQQVAMIHGRANDIRYAATTERLERLAEAILKYDNIIASILAICAGPEGDSDVSLDYLQKNPNFNKTGAQHAREALRTAFSS